MTTTMNTASSGSTATATTTPFQMVFEEPPSDAADDAVVVLVGEGEGEVTNSEPNTKFEQNVMSAIKTALQKTEKQEATMTLGAAAANIFERVPSVDTTNSSTSSSAAAAASAAASASLVGRRLGAIHKIRLDATVTTAARKGGGNNNATTTKKKARSYKRSRKQSSTKRNKMMTMMTTQTPLPHEEGHYEQPMRWVTPPSVDEDDDDDDDDDNDISTVGNDPMIGPEVPSSLARRLFGMAGCLQDADDLIESYKSGLFCPEETMGGNHHDVYDYEMDNDHIIVHDHDFGDDGFMDDQTPPENNLLRMSRKTRALEKFRKVVKHKHGEEEASYDASTEESAAVGAAPASSSKEGSHGDKNDTKPNHPSEQQQQQQQQQHHQQPSDNQSVFSNWMHTWTNNINQKEQKTGETDAKTYWCAVQNFWMGGETSVPILRATSSTDSSPMNMILLVNNNDHDRVPSQEKAKETTDEAPKQDDGTSDNNDTIIDARKVEVKLMESEPSSPSTKQQEPLVVAAEQKEENEEETEANQEPFLSPTPPTKSSLNDIDATGNIITAGLVTPPPQRPARPYNRQYDYATPSHNHNHQHWEPLRDGEEQLPPRFRKFHMDATEEPTQEPEVVAANNNEETDEPSCILLPILESDQDGTASKQQQQQQQEQLPSKVHPSLLDDEQTRNNNNDNDDNNNISIPMLPNHNGGALLFMPSCEPSNGDDGDDNNDEELYNNNTFLPGYRNSHKRRIPTVVDAARKSGCDGSLISGVTETWHAPPRGVVDNNNNTANNNNNNNKNDSSSDSDTTSEECEDDECSYGELRDQLVIVIDPQHPGCPRIKLQNTKRLNQKDENAAAIQEALDLALIKMQSVQISGRSTSGGRRGGAITTAGASPLYPSISLQRVKRNVETNKTTTNSNNEFYHQEEKKQDSFIEDDYYDEDEEDQVVTTTGHHHHHHYLGANNYPSVSEEPTIMEPHCSVEVILAEDQQIEI